MKVSRRELFERAYLFADQPDEAEETLRDVSGYVFEGLLLNRIGNKIATLLDGTGLSRPDANSVVVSLNTVQMGELNTGEYRLLLSGTKAGEREEFVKILMQVI